MALLMKASYHREEQHAVFFCCARGATSDQEPKRSRAFSFTSTGENEGVGCTVAWTGDGLRQELHSLRAKSDERVGPSLWSVTIPRWAGSEPLPRSSGLPSRTVRF